MKQFLLIILTLSYSIFSFSQNLDLIITSKGDSIGCKIDSVTSSNVYYKFPQDGNNLQRALSHSQIKLYRLGSISENDYSQMPASGTSSIRKIENERYKDLKKKYLKMPYTYHVSDKYKRDIAFLLAIIPGLGHIYTGEPQRGLAFLGAEVGSFAAMAWGFAMAWGGGTFGTPVFLVGAAGIFVFYIWNIVDAIQIAKVKNLALRDKGISMRISPTVQICNQYKHTRNFGIRLVFEF